MALNPPLGTTSPEVLLSNVKLLDMLMHGPALSDPDRGGIERLSWAGFEKRVADALAEFKSSGGVLAFDNEQTLLAYHPDRPNVLAIDTDTGNYWFWNGTSWNKSNYQVAENFKNIESQLAGLLVAIQVISKSTENVYLSLSDLDSRVLNFDKNTENQFAGLLTGLSVIEQVLNNTETNLSRLDNASTNNENTGTALLAGLSVLSGELLSVGEKQITPDEQLNLLMLAGSLAKTLQYLDGFDPANTGGGGEAVITPTIPGLYMLPEPTGLVRINVNVPTIPESKSEGEVKGTVNLSCGGGMINLYCLVSVQGNTSAMYPKKNLNVEFYPDGQFTDTVDVKIGNLLPHDEWVYKANWIDFTHVRNLMSYRLWRRVMNTRKGFPKWEIDNSYAGLTGVDAMPTGATGHPDGFPCVFNVNGQFYGIGDLMIGKKRSNYNLPKNNPLKIQVDFGEWFDITTFADTASYEFKAPKTPTAETQGAIDNWVAFCALTGDDFNNAISEKLDKTNVIDFILFIQFIAATDLVQNNNGKNIQFVSYDGVKWFFMPYDLDTTYGLYWDGKGISTNTRQDLFVGSFWKKLIQYFSADINARYQYLRSSGVFSVDSLYEIANELSLRYTQELRKAESDKWTVPSEGFATLEQIYSWSAARLEYLDSKYQYSA